MKTTIYGYVILSDFRCMCCAEGFDGDGNEDTPVTEEPYVGFRCNGCGQVYLGGGEFGTKQDLLEKIA